MNAVREDVDVITFRGPCTRSCRLFVTGFTDRVSKAAILQLFSQFGLVSHVFTKSKENSSSSNISVTVYFYSIFEAKRAASALDKAVVFRHQIRVKLCDSRTNSNDKEAPGLSGGKEERLMKMSLTRCFHVLSHFFGFDGWSSQLLKIKSLELKNKKGVLVLRRKVSALINVQGTVIWGEGCSDCEPRKVFSNDKESMFRRRKSLMRFVHPDIESFKKDEFDDFTEMPMRVLENTQGGVRKMPYDKCLKTAVSEARLDALRKLEVHVCRSTGRARAYCTV